jgi:hypothetical protein
MKVFVYYNLHKKLWSIKALEGGNKNKVIAHAMYVQLSDVTPKVSQASRQRVIRDGCKNVHAGLVGNLEFYNDDHAIDEEIINRKQITYNPYLYESFVHVEDSSFFHHSERVFLFDRKVYL